jgi:hypothetical protein
MKAAASRWIAVAGLAVVVTGLSAAAPSGLRRLPAFRIDRVEIHGAHFLTPAQVLAASGITRDASVFDDVAQWRSTLLAHPMIATATVRRRLPNTAVVRITETRPVAFARTPELRPVGAAGNLLPADPTTVDMDLPIIDSNARIDAQGHVLDAATLRTAAVLGRLQRLEPVLAPWVSEAAPLRDGVRLVLRGPANAEVLLPFDVDAQRLRQLRVTLADLAETNPSPAATGSGMTQVTRIDVRFREQVVVSLQTRGSRGAVGPISWPAATSARPRRAPSLPTSAGTRTAPRS